MRRSVNIAKNELIVRRNIATTKEAPNEAAADNRTNLLCLWACANYAGVRYARSNGLYAR